MATDSAGIWVKRRLRAFGRQRHHGHAMSNAKKYSQASSAILPEKRRSCLGAEKHPLSRGDLQRHCPAERSGCCGTSRGLGPRTSATNNSVGSSDPYLDTTNPRGSSEKHQNGRACASGSDLPGKSPTTASGSAAGGAASQHLECEVTSSCPASGVVPFKCHKRGDRHQLSNARGAQGQPGTGHGAT